MGPAIRPAIFGPAALPTMLPMKSPAFLAMPGIAVALKALSRASETSCPFSRAVAMSSENDSAMLTTSGPPSSTA